MTTSDMRPGRRPSSGIVSGLAARPVRRRRQFQRNRVAGVDVVARIADRAAVDGDAAVKSAPCGANARVRRRGR